MTDEVARPSPGQPGRNDEGTDVAETGAATVTDNSEAGGSTAEAKKTQEKKKKGKGFTVPSAFTILFFLTVFAAIATWLVPSGEYAKIQYDKEDSALVLTHPGGTETETLPATQETLDKLGMELPIEQFTNEKITDQISVPDTYEALEQNPAGIIDIPKAMVDGTVEAVDIMVFILVLGGLIGVVRSTGAFESGLMALTKKTKGNEFALVFIVSLLMVLGGSLCGLEEEAVAFYPILVPIFLAMGYDSMICVGAIFLAGSMGSAFSTINPFSVVIASNAAGTTFAEGLWWRVGGAIVAAAVVIGYLYWYAKKVKKDPAASYSYEDKEKFEKKWSMASSPEDIPKFTLSRKIILTLFAIAFPAMVWGVMAMNWAFPAMAAMFLTISIVIMVLVLFGKNHNLDEKELTDAFVEGASSLVGVSLIIGLARGINKIMNDGMISDTMLHSATNLVSGMSGPLFILIMLVIFFFLGFVVPSSSGLAVLAMPIMAPLADAVEIPRWIIVCAYQWGQYSMLFLAPTGLIMATLTMLDMKFQHWVRFVWPMVAFLLVFGGILLVAQVLIYGGAA